jgi:hypothetical protein
MELSRPPLVVAFALSEKRKLLDIGLDERLM